MPGFEVRAEELIRSFGPQILGYLTRVLGSRDDADDAFQLWAEDVWQGIGGLREPGAARVWAYRVAWNAAARLRREAWQQRRQRMPTSMASRIAAEVVSRTLGAAERETDQLASLRKVLTAEENSLLVLRIDRELSWREVAEVMAEEGKPVDEAALRQRFVRVREKLEKLARERGLLE